MIGSICGAASPSSSSTSCSHFHVGSLQPTVFSTDHDNMRPSPMLVMSSAMLSLRLHFGLPLFFLPGSFMFITRFPTLFSSFLAYGRTISASIFCILRQCSPLLGSLALSHFVPYRFLSNRKPFCTFSSQPLLAASSVFVTAELSPWRKALQAVDFSFHFSWHFLVTHTLVIFLQFFLSEYNLLFTSRSDVAVLVFIQAVLPRYSCT